MASKAAVPVKTPGIDLDSTEENNKTSGSVRKISKTVVLIIAVLVFGIIAMFTTIAVVVHISRVRAESAEFDALRELAAEIKIENHEEFGTIHLGALDEEMRKLNSDYVCWIRIDGTNIDYPVVRCDDNEKYLKTSFHGEQSITGTVFMDYRIHGDLLADSGENLIPHIIIYGHNLQQGGIFSDLRRLLNDSFLEENNIISLIVDDQVIEFEIFSARRTDVNDHAYFLNFDGTNAFPRFADRIDAPLRATQIITLSTCMSTGSDDIRLIVQGYRLIG